jgi:tetratricopeptide (TPR) repeat protein
VEGSKDEKDVKEAIRSILQTMEEMKGYLPELRENQKDLYDKFEALARAVMGLMVSILGSKESLDKTLKDLEMTQTGVVKYEERIQSHEQLLDLMRERVENLENAHASEILRKLQENDSITVGDLTIVDSLISRDANNETLLILKSHILRKMGRTEDLRVFLNQAIDACPENSELWYQKGLILQDPPDRGLECFDKSISLLKDDQRIPLHLVHFAKASLLARNGKYVEALESAIKSVESKPDCPSGWLQKAMILMKLSREPEALGCIETGIKKDPNHAGLWFGRGIALSALGKDYWSDAIASFDKVVELERKDDRLRFQALFGKGKILEKEEKNEEALACFESAIKLNDKDACAWCHKGAVLNHLDRQKDALDAFDEAQKLGIPSHCSLFYLDLFIVYNSLGLDKEATELNAKLHQDKKLIEKFEPKHRAMFDNSLAWSMFKGKGDYANGVETARRAVEISPDEAVYLDTLACNLQALGRDDEALEVFRKALANKKNDKNISWDVLASLYRRVGRITDAEEADQKAKSANTGANSQDIV